MNQNVTLVFYSFFHGLNFKVEFGIHRQSHNWNWMKYWIKITCSIKKRSLTPVYSKILMMVSTMMIPIKNDCAIDTQMSRLWLHLVKMLLFRDNIQMDVAPRMYIDLLGIIEVTLGYLWKIWTIVSKAQLSLN